MSIYSSYLARVKASGDSMQDVLIHSTKRQSYNFILNSPSKSYVRLNDSVNEMPSIVSNKETFEKRLFLFLPDTSVKVGDYVHYKGLTYLAVNHNMNDIYPELEAELCSEKFVIVKGEVREQVGKDQFGRPIYETVKEIVERDCVITTKSYSTADNSAIPLPEGSMIVKLPYEEDLIPKVNNEFKIWGEDYQVTDVSFDKVYQGVGYIEARLSREADNI